MSLHCQVEGYPTPTINWTPCDPLKNVCGKSRLNISNVQRDEIYTCTAKNILGNDTAGINLGKSIQLNLNTNFWVYKCTLEVLPNSLIIHEGNRQ